MLRWETLLVHTRFEPVSLTVQRTYTVTGQIKQQSVKSIIGVCAFLNKPEPEIHVSSMSNTVNKALQLYMKNISNSVENTPKAKQSPD